MDARAAPLLLGWVVMGMLLWWGVRPGATPGDDPATVLIGLAVVAGAWTAQHVMRRRGHLHGASSIDLVDVGSLAVLCGAVAGVVDADGREAILATLGCLTGIGIVYLVTGFGLVEIGAWGIGRLIDEAGRIAELVARTLPVLLILVLFLVFASELWQAAHEVNGGELAAVLLLIVGVAVLLIVSALRAEMRDFAGDESLRDAASRTPAHPLAEAFDGPIPPLPRLSWIQRLNIGLLAVVSQLIQSVFVGAVVTGFLVVLGLLALPASLQAAWVAAPPDTIVAFGFLGETRTLTRELATVAALLGGVVGLYFTGLAVTDAGYRGEHFGRVMEEIRQLVAARTLYVAGIQARDAQAGASP